MRIAATVLASVTVLSLNILPVQARCSVQSFNFPFGQPGASANTTMTVSGGDSCNIKLREAANSVFKSIAVTTRPSHGTVRPLNPINVTYKPRAGFQGQDNFVFSLTGIKAGAAATARITVSVTVEGGGSSSSTSTAPAASVRHAATRAAATPTGLRMECLKQAGASLDPVTKRWTFYMTERDGASRTAKFRLCLAGGDRAKARTLAVPERATNPASSIPSRF